jgi:2,3-dihydroxybiphenyl 1,2-dioxygenase
MRMDEYHHRFALHPNGKDDVSYVGWEVADEHALQAMSAQLQAAGVKMTPGSAELAGARRVVALITFNDPNGIATEVFYGPLVNFDAPFASPRAISDFETGTQGLGHIVVGVDDLDTSLHFYRDLLGRRISDFIQLSGVAGGRRMAFFHCNPRHHSLAFMAMPNAAQRLRHFMLQVKALDDVGMTYFLCQDQGVPVARGMGRHTNDHMVSFYMQSPSGFEVEYGWGARVVDDSTWQVQQHTRGSIWGHRPQAAQPAPQPMVARV